jgi:hypothetical protein
MKLPRLRKRQAKKGTPSQRKQSARLEKLLPQL